MTVQAYATNLITAEHWRRFEIYATKTRILAMNRPAVASMSNGWLLHLAMSKARPDPLFPQLDRLIITSDDILSLFVAHSCAPYAKAVTINFDEHADEASEEPGASLAATICENTRDVARLTQVRLLRPIDSLYALRNVCLSPSITTLHVCVGPAANKEDFARIATCRTLKELMIRQILAPNDNTASDPDLWPTSLRTQEHIDRAANLPHLKSLSISCNALTHFQAAQSLAPASLTHLRLEVQTDAFKGQALLLPLVFAIQMTRNPSLVNLQIVCSVDEDITPESVAERRNEWQYMDFRLLYTGLKGLQNLTTLKIMKIPFLAVDVLDRILDIVLELPVLQVLALSPRPISTMEGDALVLPPLSRLEEVARKSTNLVTLELAVDFTTIPVVPNGFSPSTRLTTLRIYELPEESLFVGSFSTDELLSLARYLDKVFPNLKILTAGWEEGSDQWRLWNYMEKLVQSFQDFRAEARREFQQATSTQVHP